ncbi:MAG: hypothetical protein WCW47_01925 [Candidatus Paceibacterota bacterium]|jgi:hypothetical protein
MKIRVNKRLRVLKRREGTQLLHHTELSLSAGTVVETREPEECGYDHRVLKALPLTFKGKEFYILESDVNPNSWTCSAIIIDDAEIPSPPDTIH